MSRLLSALVTGLAVALLAGVATAAADPIDDPGPAVELRLRPMPDGVKRMHVEPTGDGGHVIVVSYVDGRRERVRPDELVARIDRESRGRRFLYRLLNITSPIGIAWVLLGLLGQVAFVGRMVVQWLVSESQSRSVVPVAFWWLSLAGASMLLVYFVWRRDIVGVLGQSTGWVIYLRNLWLIRREGRAA